MARTRVVVKLDPAIAALLRKTVKESHVGLSDFVQAAVVNRLKSWEAPAAFVAGRREKLDRTPTRPWGDECDALGLPKAYNVVEPLAEISRELRFGGEAAVQRWMQSWWETAGLGEYSAECLAATLREHKRQTAKRSKRRPADAEPEPTAAVVAANPPGFGEWPNA